MTFLDGILVAAIVGMLFCVRSVDNDYASFERRTTNSLRGVAMVGIMLHHIHNNLGFFSPILSQVGYLATGLFFFISGYGNTLSIGRRNDIKINWLMNKAIKIYIPFIVSYVLYIIMLAIGYRDMIPNFMRNIFNLVTVTLPNQVSWFPKIILLCFIIQWVAHKITSKNVERANVIILITICAFIIFIKMKNWDSYWTSSVLCYPTGCCMAESIKVKRIAKFIRNKRMLSFLSCGVCFCLLFMGTRYCYDLSIICSVAFSVTCYCFTQLFSVKNRLMEWIGKNSFEFYVFHIVCLQGWMCVSNVYIYSLLVLVTSIVMVCLYSEAKKIVIKNKGK